MKKSYIVLAALLVCFLFGAAFVSCGVGKYNGMVKDQQDVEAQLGKVSSAYQQRADLIPNLVEIVKGSAVQERETLTDVITARSKASSIQLTPEALKDPQAMKNFTQAQDGLSGALSRLMVVTEKYPDLKSQANFTTLMSQLEGQENRIRVERKTYNETVRRFDVEIKTFPNNFFATTMGFTAYQYFESSADAKNAPKIKF